MRAVPFIVAVDHLRLWVELGLGNAAAEALYGPENGEAVHAELGHKATPDVFVVLVWQLRHMPHVPLVDVACCAVIGAVTSVGGVGPVRHIRAKPGGDLGNYVEVYLALWEGFVVKWRGIRAVILNSAAEVSSG